MATSIELDSFIVSAVYDFSAAGPGTFTFHPASKFQVIGTNNTIEANIARSVPITVIDVSKRELDLEKRVTAECFDGQLNKTIMDIYWEARVMANYAIINIERKGPDDSHYKKYFGSNNFVDVMANFITIVSPPDDSRYLDCNKDSYCHDMSYRYKNEIIFCPRFFALPPSKILCVEPARLTRETRGGAMLMALSPPHLNENDATCEQAQNLPNPTKLTTAANYVVSTKTPRCLSRARMLTGVMTFIVLRRHDLRTLY